MKYIPLLFILLLYSCNNKKIEYKECPGYDLWAHPAGHYNNDLSFEETIQQSPHSYITEDSVYFKYFRIFNSNWCFPEIDCIYLKYPTKIVKIIPRISGFLDTKEAQYIALSIDDILYKEAPVKIRFITNNNVIDGGPIYNYRLVNTIQNYRKWQKKEKIKQQIINEKIRIKDSINNIKLNNHLYDF